MGIVNFSLEIKNLDKIWDIWKLVCKIKSRTKVNPRIINYMEAAFKVEQPIRYNLDQAKSCYIEARAKYLAVKTDAPKIIEALLLDIMDTLAII